VATARRNQASAPTGAIRKRPYHPPSIVQLGSIESAREALEATRDPRLLLIVERSSMISEEVRQTVADRVAASELTNCTNNSRSEDAPTTLIQGTNTLR